MLESGAVRLPHVATQSMVTPLAAGFARASLEEWRGLVIKTLKGVDPDNLVTPGADGVEIAALYRPVTAGGAFPVPRSDRRGMGAPPWDIRAVVSHPDPARANADFLADLAGGVASGLAVLDPAGRDGVAVGSAAEFARLVDGVSIDVAPIALDAGFVGPLAAAWLAAAAKASPAAPLAFHLDPLSAFARAGESPGPIDAHVEAAAQAAAPLAETYPNASLFLASGRAVHEAGGAPADELAFALASALAYAKAVGRAGVPADRAFNRLVLGLSADADILVSVAKLRAARIAWAKLTTACGASGPARLEARSSARMLARADAWTNLVRLTVTGFAAAVGGADAIVLDPFTAPLGPPTPLARRMARNTQLILMEEAHVGAVADPLAGSGAVEALSEQISRDAWTGLRELERRGGVVEALRSGHVAERAAAGREALRGALAVRSLRLIGVTDFRADGLERPQIETVECPPTIAPDVRQRGGASRCPPILAMTLEDLAAVSSA